MSGAPSGPGGESRPRRGSETQPEAVRYWCMRALKAHVRGGRLVLDEPTELPEGAEVELTVVEDDFDPEERARLLEALDAGIAAARDGDHVEADEFIRELLGRP